MFDAQSMSSLAPHLFSIARRAESFVVNDAVSGPYRVNGTSGELPADGTAKWEVKEIVYTSIMGVVMVAAALEWFLWVAAFMYCLIKVYIKAEHWSIKFLAVVMTILFTLFRVAFLPVMVFTLPLPPHITKHFPVAVVNVFQWFGFFSFAALLTIPWLFCVYNLVTHTLGRKKRVHYVLDELSAPKVVIVMPCYKEIPEVLVRSVDSVVDCDYPPSCLHVFLSFDGDQQDELYLNTIEKLGVPLSLDDYPPSIDVTYRNTRITVSRFPHGGKRHCQKRTFKLIDKIYREYLRRNDNLFILFIDSDCILDPVCIQNFMWEMELQPGSKRNMLAMTGVITATTEKTTLITLLQDMEYIHGQLFERSVESACGAVTCLPGALTVLRFSAFRKMAKYYFADKAEQCEDLFDFGKCHLGEDRWLTHLFMIGAKEKYQLQMCTGAFCKTEAVQTYQSLLKQRRRWFLGFITNEVCMLTDIRLWKRYPVLCIIRFMQNTIRTTALLFFVMVLSLMTTISKVQNLPVGFIAVSLGLNWVLMVYFAFRLGRYKALLYPLMFIINPFFNWVYMVYGIFTAGQRTWGGPRADAGAADGGTTVQEAIEHAEATGDDLNVVPETFRSGPEKQKPLNTVSLMPDDNVDGMFSQPTRGAGGWYDGTENNLELPESYERNPDAPRLTLHPRISWDSMISADTTAAQSTVNMPRRVESIMSEEDRRKYLVAQQSQRDPGGAHYEMRRDFEMSDDEKGGKWSDSDDSIMYEGHTRTPSGGSSNFSSPRNSANRNVVPLGHTPSVTAPETAMTSGDRGTLTSSRSRGGRSPLARLSLVRTAGEQIEMRQPSPRGGSDTESSRSKLKKNRPDGPGSA